MTAYLCNCCKNPIITSEARCAHLEIRWGKKALESKGQTGDGYSVDLCEDCYKKLADCVGFVKGLLNLSLDRILSKSREVDNG